MAKETIGDYAAELATQFIGVPYYWGGTTPKAFDCSGLVNYVYDQLGIKIPRNSKAQFDAAAPVNNPQPGDLVFFSINDRLDHVGMYIGNDKFIQSGGYRGAGVNVANIADWKGQISGYGRPYQGPTGSDVMPDLTIPPIPPDKARAILVVGMVDTAKNSLDDASLGNKDIINRIQADTEARVMRMSDAEVVSAVMQQVKVGNSAIRGYMTATFPDVVSTLDEQTKRDQATAISNAQSAKIAEELWGRALGPQSATTSTLPTQDQLFQVYNAKIAPGATPVSPIMLTAAQIRERAGAEMGKLNKWVDNPLLKEDPRQPSMVLNPEYANLQAISDNAEALANAPFELAYKKIQARHMESQMQSGDMKAAIDYEKWLQDKSNAAILTPLQIENAQLGIAKAKLDLAKAGIDFSANQPGGIDYQYKQAQIGNMGVQAQLERERNQLMAEQSKISAAGHLGTLANQTTRNQIDAAPWAMPPGAEFLPGFEPGGLMEKMYSFSGTQFNPIKAFGTEVNPNAAWDKVAPLLQQLAGVGGQQ